MVRHILLVEDDAAIREAFCELLLSKKYQVNTAEHGQLALDYLNTCNETTLPDLIFLDLRMPVMNGFEFLVKFRMNQKINTIPIIVLSAGTDSKGLPEDISVLKKPIDLSEMFAAIEAISISN